MGRLTAHGRCKGLKVVKSLNRVSGRSLPVHLFRHFCCRMYFFSHNAQCLVKVCTARSVKICSTLYSRAVMMCNDVSAVTSCNHRTNEDEETY